MHRLGAIGKIDDDISNKNILKMKVLRNKDKILLTIFPKVFNELSSRYFENKFSLRHPQLDDFYIDISLASSHELIMEKWNENSTLNLDIFHKDLIESENTRVGWSRNADGGRSKNVILTDEWQ